MTTRIDPTPENRWKNTRYEETREEKTSHRYGSQQQDG